MGKWKRVVGSGPERETRAFQARWKACGASVNSVSLAPRLGEMLVRRLREGAPLEHGNHSPSLSQDSAGADGGCPSRPALTSLPSSSTAVKSTRSHYRHGPSTGWLSRISSGSRPPSIWVVFSCVSLEHPRPTSQPLRICPRPSPSHSGGSTPPYFSRVTCFLHAPHPNPFLYPTSVGL